MGSNLNITSGFCTHCFFVHAFTSQSNTWVLLNPQRPYGKKTLVHGLPSYGSDRVGSGRVGSGRVGSGRVRSSRANLPSGLKENAEYLLNNTPAIPLPVSRTKVGNRGLHAHLHDLCCYVLALRDLRHEVFFVPAMISTTNGGGRRKGGKDDRGRG